MELPGSLLHFIGDTRGRSQVGIIAEPMTNGITMMGEGFYSVDANFHAYKVLHEHVFGASSDQATLLGLLCDAEHNLVFGATYAQLHIYFGYSAPACDREFPDLSSLRSLGQSESGWHASIQGQLAASRLSEELEACRVEERGVDNI